jgi:hypothetical protein
MIRNRTEAVACRDPRSQDHCLGSELFLLKRLIVLDLMVPFVQFFIGTSKPGLKLMQEQATVLSSKELG